MPRPARSAASSSKSTPKKKPTPVKAKPKAKLSRKKSASTELDSPSSAESSEDDDDASDAYEEDSTADTDIPSDEEEEEEEEELAAELDSDNLDEDSDEDATPKRKRKGGAKAGSAAKGGSNKKQKIDPHGKNTREVDALELAQAPDEDPETTLILPSTLSFLYQLKHNNERPWFQAHDALYRHALKNVNTFLEAMIPKVSAIDWQVPELPLKDLTHRIYRDVRFSKSKVPYKTNLGATYSRTGRKTSFAMYYMHVSPGGQTVLGAGVWDPEADVTKKIRDAILRDSKPFRKAISEPAFVKLFGKPKPVKRYHRVSVFGHDSELVNCPKLEDRNGEKVTIKHPDIDLLKLRTVAVSCHFADDLVLSNEFMDKMEEAVKVAMPFVQMVNDMIDPPEDGPDGAAADDDDDEAEAEESD